MKEKIINIGKHIKGKNTNLFLNESNWYNGKFYILYLILKNIYEVKEDVI